MNYIIKEYNQLGHAHYLLIHEEIAEAQSLEQAIYTANIHRVGHASKITVEIAETHKLLAVRDADMHWDTVSDE